MKGHEPLVRVLTLAYSIIVGLILFLVVFGETNQGRYALDDTLSRILVGLLVSTILGVLVFLLVWHGPQPLPATAEASKSQKRQEGDRKKKRR